MDFEDTKAFALIYSFKCNAECPHCADKCGPHRTEKMNTEDMKYIIKNAASAGFNFVELLGGEPFLDYNQLADIISFCSESHVKSEVVTNGFWGKAIKTAKSKLEYLIECGLDAIAISVDSYHKQFIPTDYPLNIVRIAKELKLYTYCVFCPSMNAKEDNVILKSIKKITDQIYTLPVISETGTEKYPGPAKSFDHLEPCHLLETSIGPDGYTTSCANNLYDFHDIKDTPLYMGDCLKDNIQEVLTNKNYFRLYSFFYNPDSDIYYKKIAKEKLNKTYTGICDFCLEAMQNKEILDAINNYIPEYHR